MKETVVREVEVRYCDLCYEETGQKVEAEGMYSTCDKCHKDICSRHHDIGGGEEESYCVRCSPYNKKCPHCGK